MLILGFWSYIFPQDCPFWNGLKVEFHSHISMCVLLFLLLFRSTYVGENVLFVKNSSTFHAPVSIWLERAYLFNVFLFGGAKIWSPQCTSYDIRTQWNDLHLHMSLYFTFFFFFSGSPFSFNQFIPSLLYWNHFSVFFCSIACAWLRESSFSPLKRPRSAASLGSLKSVSTGSFRLWAW